MTSAREDDAYPHADTTDVPPSSLRALLLVGLDPMEDGRGLAGRVRAWLQARWMKKQCNSAGNDESCDDATAGHGRQLPPFAFKFDKTVHSRVRDGAVLIFRSSSAAAAALAVTGVPEGHPGDFRVIGATNVRSAWSLSYAAGRIRDHAYGYAPFATRRVMALDSISVMSISDMATADRMAAITLLVPNNGADGAGVISLWVDGTASAGGNTLGLVRAARAKWRDTANSGDVSIEAFEMDTGRHAMLAFNVQQPMVLDTDSQAACRRVAVTSRCEDFFAHAMTFLARASAPRAQVLFLDPPWGGTTHQELATLPGIVACSSPGGWSPEALSMVATQRTPSSAAVGNEVIIPLVAALAALLPTGGRAGYAVTTGVKLPRSPAGDAVVAELAARVTARAAEEALMSSSDSERPFPFLFSFGHSTQLLVVIDNAASRRRSSAEDDDDDEIGCGWGLTNGTLDGAIARLMSWHNSNDVFAVDAERHDIIFSGSGGSGEHRPRFFDFEKRRWIELKKWIPGLAANGMSAKGSCLPSCKE